MAHQVAANDARGANDYRMVHAFLPRIAEPFRATARHFLLIVLLLTRRKSI